MKPELSNDMQMKCCDPESLSSRDRRNPAGAGSSFVGNQKNSNNS